MNSEEYFIKREKKWQEQQIKNDKQRMAEIKKRLQDAQDEIQKEIDAQWDNFSNGQKISRSEAMKRAFKMDVEAFARKAKKYVQEKNFSQEANRQLKLYNLTMRVNRLELLKASIGLEIIATFNDLDKYFSGELTAAGLEELKRQAGILGTSVSEKEYSKLVEQVINSSFRTSDFPTFSDTLWQYQSELKADLDKMLVRGVTQGKNPKQLASELAKYLTKEGVENTKYNTQRLMVTETTRVQGGIQKQSYLDAGIEEYGWVIEPNACKLCKSIAKAGPYLVKEMEIGKNMIPVHPWDRCSTYPIVDRDKFEQDLARRGL
ncbi:phage head morphogenesis protein [Erwinia sp. CPCC 100877]|nr:phage head morphogenesis protein [Erwinia sp. CPCC 100877]